VVQTRFRAFLEYQRFSKARQQIILMQSIIRKWIGVSRFVEIKQKVVILQSIVRKWIACKAYKHMVTGNPITSELLLIYT
jgi:hypothetical protein